MGRVSFLLLYAPGLPGIDALHPYRIRAGAAVAFGTPTGALGTSAFPGDRGIAPSRCPGALPDGNPGPLSLELLEPFRSARKGPADANRRLHGEDARGKGEVDSCQLCVRLSMLRSNDRAGLLLDGSFGPAGKGTGSTAAHGTSEARRNGTLEDPAEPAISAGKEATDARWRRWLPNMRGLGRLQANNPISSSGPMGRQRR